MKRLASLVAIIACIFSFVVSSVAAALNVTVQPPVVTTSSTPNVVISTLGGNSLLDFAEIYNQSGAPVNLAGWQIAFTVHSSSGCADQTFQVAAPAGWLLPKNYFTFERGLSPANDNSEAYFSVPANFLTNCITPQLTNITLFDANENSEQAINFAPGTLNANNWAVHKQRGKSTLTVTGTFLNDYILQTTSSVTLNSVPLYNPAADTAGLQIVELLPHSLNCGPTDTSLTCSDYIKLYNSSNKPTDLSVYRLRTSYDGAKSTSSNTIILNGSLAPGDYSLVNTKNDGSPLGLTESGGYVWLEDTYGVRIYQPVIQYPDASSATKVDWAWAFDGTAWRWTSDPTLEANDFPSSDQAATTSSASASTSLKPCAANQYRNPVTNRCKLIVSALTLATCKADQERNPETNRCRSIFAAGVTLTPCKAGQQRNPATNRCRSVLGASTTLKPCAAGWQRNPATNRCRKLTAANLASVQDIKTTASPHANHLRWIIAAIALIAALGYAIYEWRSEIAVKLGNTKRKLASVLAKLKS